MDCGVTSNEKGLNQDAISLLMFEGNKIIIKVVRKKYYYFKTSS